MISERAGLEVLEVVPVKRIPKTTSGKIQRHLLEQSYVAGEFAAQLTELRALRERSVVRCRHCVHKSRKRSGES